MSEYPPQKKQKSLSGSVSSPMHDSYQYHSPPSWEHSYYQLAPDPTIDVVPDEIYVRNMPKDVAVYEIVDTFRLFGDVTKYKWTSEYQSGMLVRFRTVEQATAALSYQGVVTVRDQPLSVLTSTRKKKTQRKRKNPSALSVTWMNSSPPMGRTCSFIVTNVGFDVSAEQLAQALGFQDISCVSLAPHDDGFSHKGHGTVYFYRYEDAARVFSTLNKKRILGRKLFMEWVG